MLTQFYLFCKAVRQGKSVLETKYVPTTFVVNIFHSHQCLGNYVHKGANVFL